MSNNIRYFDLKDKNILAVTEDSLVFLNLNHINQVRHDRYIRDEILDESLFFYLDPPKNFRNLHTIERFVNNHEVYSVISKPKDHFDVEKFNDRELFLECHDVKLEESGVNNYIEIFVDKGHNPRYWLDSMNLSVHEMNKDKSFDFEKTMSDLDYELNLDENKLIR